MLGVYVLCILKVYIMTDIFDAKINCKNCDIEMQKCFINKNGFQLRAVKCSKCGDRIIHPSDMNSYQHFNDLKGKTFQVKLRMVGNSHAISIPKEIVDFINEMHKDLRNNMDDMVRLCFEDFGKLSVRFDNSLNNKDYKLRVLDGREDEER